MGLILALLLLQDVDALLRQLRDEDPKVRSEAAAVLKKLEPESTAIDEKLSALTESRDPDAAELAKRVLHHRRLSRAVGGSDELFAKLTSPYSQRRIKAIDYLSKAGRDAVPYLKLMFEGDDSDAVRRHAALRLAEISTPDCVEALRLALVEKKDSWSEVRRASLESLSKLKDDFARQVVFSLLERATEDPQFGRLDRDEPHFPIEQNQGLLDVALNAAAGPFKSDRALSDMRQIFRDSTAVTARRRFLVLGAAARWPEALERLRPDILEALSEDEPRWLVGSGHIVAETKPVERVDTIRRLAADRYYVVSACLILAELKDRESIPLLLRIAKHGGVKQRKSTRAAVAAAWALGEIASPESVPGLLEVWDFRLKGRESVGVHSVLPSILTALGRIGDKRALSVMIRALQDPEEEVRHAAVRAIGRMHARDFVSRLILRLDDIIGFPLYEDNPREFQGTFRMQHSVRGAFEPTPIPILKHDATVRDAVLPALEQITGRKFSGTPENQVKAWKNWWSKHKDEYP